MKLNFLWRLFIVGEHRPLVEEAGTIIISVSKQLFVHIFTYLSSEALE